MGSFNVSCGVSRISIGAGTPMVLIPLISAGKWADKMEGAFVVTGGPTRINIPFTLPIFGEYNDYGTLENIKEDCNTKAIEKYFGCSIGDFVDKICRPFDDITLWSDGTWVRIELNGKEINESIFNPKDLVQFLKKYSLYVPHILYTFKNCLYYDVEYDKELEVIRKFKTNYEKMAEILSASGETEETTKKLLSSMSAMEFLDNSMLKFGNPYSNDGSFYEMYSSLFDDKSFKDLVVKFRTFERGLFSVNVLYMPSWNGFQCGCHHANYNLAKLVQEILKKQFKEDRKYVIKNWWWRIKYNTNQRFKKIFKIKNKDE